MTSPLPPLVGGRKAIEALRIAIDQAARVNSAVLIEGETGTGKELVALHIQAKSQRARSPFVAINCSAIPAELFEAELFGTARGAFTGAFAEREGLLETAEGGTVFLDEIETLSFHNQPKLLRVLETGEIRRLGSRTSRLVNVRFLAATNEDLEELIQERRFRADLFYRLATLQISVPPLRDHIDDIPALVEHFVRQYNVRNSTNYTVLATSLLPRLYSHTWPGNVRELRNHIEQLLTGIEPSPQRVSVGSNSTGRHRIAASEIVSVLTRNFWNRSAAAAALGMSRATLWRKMKKHKIDTGRQSTANAPLRADIRVPRTLTPETSRLDPIARTARSRSSVQPELIKSPASA